MDRIAKVALVAVVVGLAALVLIPVTRRAIEAPRSGVAPTHHAHVGERATNDRSSGPEDARAAVDAPPAVAVASSAESAAAVSAPSPETTARGKVIDVHGRGLSGIKVVAATGEHADSKAGGAFELTLVTAATLSIADGQGLAPVADARWRPGERGELLVVASPAIPLAGLVVRAGDRVPIAGARLRVRLAETDWVGLGSGTEAAIRRDALATSDEAGAFAFDAAPAGCQLFVEAAGHARAVLRPPELGDAAMVIELESRDASAPPWTGIVLDESGAPVPGAHVSAGTLAVRSDGIGEFVLPSVAPRGMPDVSAAREIVAVATGFLPARRALEDVAEGTRIELVLTRADFAIFGVVVDAMGEPLEGVLVTTRDTTAFGAIEAAPGVLYPTSIEALLAGQDDFGCRTDAEGAFRLAGLLERSYALELVDERTMAVVTSAPIAAGTANARIVFHGGARGRVEGRVLDLSGGSIAGARLDLLRIPGGDPRNGVTPGPSTVTADDGSFAFEDVATDDVFLNVQGPTFVPRMVPLDGLQTVELRVARRCVLSVRSGRTGVGFNASALDAGGNPCPVHVFESGYRQQAAFAVPSDGSPIAVVLPEDCASIRATASDGIETRVSFVLDPERTTEIVLAP